MPHRPLAGEAATDAFLDLGAGILQPGPVIRSPPVRSGGTGGPVVPGGPPDVVPAPGERKLGRGRILRADERHPRGGGTALGDRASGSICRSGLGAGTFPSSSGSRVSRMVWR